MSRASGVRRRRTHTSDMLREVGGDRDLLHQAALDTPCAVSKALARRCCYPGLLQTTPKVSAASLSASEPVRECIRKPATHGMRVAGVHARAAGFRVCTSSDVSASSSSENCTFPTVRSMSLWQPASSRNETARAVGPVTLHATRQNSPRLRERQPRGRCSVYMHVVRRAICVLLG